MFTALALLFATAASTATTIATTIAGSVCIGLAAKGISDSNDAERIRAEADEKIAKQKQDLKKAHQQHEAACQQFVREQKRNNEELDAIMKKVKKCQ